MSISPEVWDVVVCGGGTAGAAAAIAAGRQGAKTLVIEQFGSLGGTQTNAWVTPMMPNYVGPFKLSRGLSMDITEAQTEMQPQGDLDHGDDWYDPAALALILDQLAIEAGVTCLFNATIIGARVANGKLQAVEVATRAGRQWIEGKTFIDSTGDADLAMYAGAELMGGDDSGTHQPMTLRFTMGNIDIEKARASLLPFLRTNTKDYIEMGYGEAMNSPMKDLVWDAVSKGILAEDDLGYFQLFSVNGRPGEFAFNTPRVANLDPLDPFEISRAYQIGRAKIYRIAEFMRQTFAGFENAFVSVIAPLMGIRESRRVVGEYILTEEDHLSCRKFEDAIAHNRYPIDIHLKGGIDYRKFPPGEYHDVPYRSLVVKGFDNFWVAGRCLSATFVAQSAVRIQSVCRSMGEAAGIAAAICSREGFTAQGLPYEKLREHLDLSVPE
ncbi:MAG TPA: FAD-dependent oxidoreductase [Fimbriimonadaceae bacterium]|jgi:hypothetical protein